MPKSKPKVIRANRDMLYAMAAVSTFGEKTTIVINFDSWDPDAGTLVFAMQVRENAESQRKQDAHKNGWAYYEVGLAKPYPLPLSESELEERVG